VCGFAVDAATEAAVQKAEANRPSRPPRTTVSEFLGRIKLKLTGAPLTELQAAEGIDANNLARLLMAENEGTLHPTEGTAPKGRAFDALAESLRKANWDSARIDALMESVRSVNEGYRKSDSFRNAAFEAETDAAIQQLADPTLALPKPAALQTA